MKATMSATVTATAVASTAPLILAWRHPRAEGARGRCIGRTDLPVPARRSKRLARRIQAAARRHRLARVVHTSPQRRCADVGRWLSRWGWAHVMDDHLCEMDFGRWDGRPWTDIGQTEVDAWCAQFADHAPGGGETLRALLQRARAWTPPTGLAAGTPCVVVGHAGWMLARRWCADHPHRLPHASDWPAPPPNGHCWGLR